ncbi:hypothetical protein [Caminibacter pacificus]
MHYNFRGGWIPTIIGQLHLFLINPQDYRLDRIKGNIYYKDLNVENKDFTNIIVTDIDFRDIKKDKKKHFKYLTIINIMHIEPNKESLHGTFYILPPDNKINLKALCEEKNSYAEQTNWLYKTNYQVKNSGLVLFQDTSAKDKKPLEIEKILTIEKQVFIFLKYIFHSNAHHHYSQENISTYVFAETYEQLLLKIYLHMKYILISIRKSSKGNPETLKNTEGIIEYLITYLLILENELKEQEKTINIDFEKEMKFLYQFKNSIKILTECKQPTFPTLYNLIKDIQLFSIIVLPILAPLLIIFFNHKFLNNFTFLDIFMILNDIPILPTYYFITLSLMLISFYIILIALLILFIDLSRVKTGHPSYVYTFINHKLTPLIKKILYKKVPICNQQKIKENK